MSSSRMASATSRTVSPEQGHQAPRTVPRNFGLVLFPTFQALDVFGPLDALNILARKYQMNLYIIAETLDPVTTKPPAALDTSNSNFGESVLPTHTFETAPPLDVLIVPGGRGTRADSVNSTIDFIKKSYPTVQYLITVCTGAGLAARAGVLDGKYATTNKLAWAETTILGPKVKWVSHARWVIDGNIWTSSGISAGIDVALAWIEAIYGNVSATEVANRMEYERNLDPNRDPFAELYNLTTSASGSAL